MPPTPFGERLRREREMRGVTIQEISTATRISTRFLEALENEQWDQLPGGVFNRGFIRSIARFLGLDEESLVAEYALGIKASPDARAPVVRHPAEIPRDWRPIAVAGVICVALLAGIFALYHYGPILVSHLRARRHRVAHVAAQPAQSADLGGTPTAVLPAPTVPLVLRIEMTRPATVRVRADGKVVFSGRLRRREIKTFEANQNFEIASSESAAVGIELNGQPVSSSASGKAASLTLTRDDLKPIRGAAH